MTDDPFNLERFVAAQASTFDQALEELREGHKRGHWMWFIFPQMRGLGRSGIAQAYGIASRAEAGAYRAHPILGDRLVSATQAVLRHEDTTARAIFGTPDEMKFRSSMTLFAAVDQDGPFRATLVAFYEGTEDAATLKMLEIANR